MDISISIQRPSASPILVTKEQCLSKDYRRLFNSAFMSLLDGFVFIIVQCFSDCLIVVIASILCVIAIILCLIAFILVIAFILQSWSRFILSFKLQLWSFLFTMVILVSLDRDSAPVPFSCPFLDGGVISYLHGSCYLSKKGPASVSYRFPRVRYRHVIVAFLINTSVSLCKVESAPCAFGKR